MRAVKRDFPIFKRLGERFVYLDSAATSQKPASVIAAEQYWYEHLNANVHRGVYQLSEWATEAYNESRAAIARFIGAPSAETIVFVRGTTEGLNLVAQGWAKYHLKPGDTILLTQMEHHANIVPWQLLAKEKKLSIRWWPITSSGRLVLRNIDRRLSGVKLVSMAHASNVLGTVNPIAAIIHRAHRKGIPVSIDAAKSAPHLPLNVRTLDPDFLTFSGHKMLGPTGIGALYIKPERHAEMRPYQGGGDMIASVSFKETTFKPVPEGLEAGTQALAQVYGFKAAVEYLERVGMAEVARYDAGLVQYAYRKLSAIPEVTIVGPGPADRIGLIAFLVRGVHAHDLASFLDQHGICIRAGHHCAQPLHERLGLEATARISFYLYTTRRDIDRFITALKTIIAEWHSTKQ